MNYFPFISKKACKLTTFSNQEKHQNETLEIFSYDFFIQQNKHSLVFNSQKDSVNEQTIKNCNLFSKNTPS